MDGTSDRSLSNATAIGWYAGDDALRRPSFARAARVTPRNLDADSSLSTLATVCLHDDEAHHGAIECPVEDPMLAAAAAEDDATHRLRRRWFAGAFVSLLACGSMAVLALRLSPAATMAAAAPPALAPVASSYNALPRPIESARRRRLRRA